MATFSGVIAKGGSGQAVNVNGTANLDGRTLPRWQAVSVLDSVQKPLAGALQDNSPIPGFPAESFAGQRACSYFDDFYNRIYFTPNPLDFEAVIADTDKTFDVWSAFLGPQTLEFVSADLDPTVNLIHPATPLEFAGLELKTYTVQAALNGPPGIDTSYTFIFEGVEYDLQVLGTRIRLWPYSALVPARETLEWLTDILPSYKNEQRLALRRAPRQSFRYSHNLTTREFSYAKLLNQTWGQNNYAVPVWHEAQAVGDVPAGTGAIAVDTSWGDWRDNLLIWSGSESYQIAKIAEVQPGSILLEDATEQSLKGAWAVPLRVGRLINGAQFARSTPFIPRSDVEFLISDNVDLGATPWPQYRNRDLVTDCSVILGSMNERIVRAVTEVDNGSGPVVVLPDFDYATHAQNVTFQSQDRAQQWQFRQWLHSLRGQQRGFWLPSWNKDLELVENIVSGATQFRIKAIGYPDFLTVSDVAFVLHDDSLVTARVLTGAASTDGTELLDVETPFAGDIDVADVQMLCFMSYIRLNADRVTIDHEGARFMRVSIPAITTPES